MQPGQEDAAAVVDLIRDDLAGLQLQVQRLLNDRRRDFQQLLRHGHQLIERQPAVAIVHGLGQREADAGARPDHRGLLDPQPGCDGVGRLEADPADVAGEAIGVLREDLDGVRAIGLEDPHGARGADAVRVQEDHDLADDLLIGPPGDDPLGPLRADAGDVSEPLRLRLDDVEHRLGKRLHQPLGVDGADPSDHAGAEILLDPFDRRGRCRAQEARFELRSVRSVVDPDARRLNELAGADHRRVTDHGDQVTLAPRLDAQNAEAVVRVVERDALDQAGETFALFASRS